MINSEAFAKRLEEILKYYDLSASSFAEKIDVGRASISHILSGRNKPSLDFVMKIVKEFSEVELYWLINGKGQFPKNNETTPPSKEAQPEKKSNQNYKISNDQNLQSEKQLSSEVSKVIVFYKDGRFEVFDEQI
ncbi:MAG: helix-turn-helix transcriptional regulator [Psychroflexus halocasei]